MPMVRSAKGVTFGCSQRRVAAFRVAGVLPSNPKKELTIHVRRLCCSRAARLSNRVPLDRASVIAAAAAKTKKQTNSRTSQPPKDTRGEGGSHGGR